MTMEALILTVLLLGSVVALAIRVAPESDRFAVYRLARFHRVLGPGFVVIIPLVDRAVRFRRDENADWRSMSLSQAQEYAKRRALERRFDKPSNSTMWAVPHSFSWDFTVRDATLQPVAEVKLSRWGEERGTVSVAGVEHKVSRQGVLGAFTLQKAGSVLARAEEMSAFRNGPRPDTALAPGGVTFEIEHEGKQYILKERGTLYRREGVLYEGEREIGVVGEESSFSTVTRVELPEELPLVLRLFVIWLSVLFSKRLAHAIARTPTVSG